MTEKEKLIQQLHIQLEEETALLVEYMRLQRESQRKSDELSRQLCALHGLA